MGQGINDNFMVQVIPKKSIKKQLVLKDLLPWFFLLFLVVLIGLYFIFIFQVNRANVSLDKVKTELSEVRTKEDIELEKTILTYKRKVGDLALILQTRQKSIEFFEFLEKFVHPNIYFSSVSLSLDTEKVFLKGVSSDFKSLAEQLFIFEREPSIEEAELSNISLLEGGKIDFDIKLLLLTKVSGEAIKGSEQSK